MLQLAYVVDEPPALIVDGTLVPLTTPVAELERIVRPSRFDPRPTFGIQGQLEGMTEWHFGTAGIFFIVGTRLEVVTVQWRRFGLFGENVELIEGTSSVQTSAGFSRDHSFEDLLAIHGVPSMTRLDITHQSGKRRLTTEYDLFDGFDDFVRFRVSFEDDLATTLQFARTSVFNG